MLNAKQLLLQQYDHAIFFGVAISKCHVNYPNKVRIYCLTYSHGIRNIFFARVGLTPHGLDVHFATSKVVGWL
jgi:sialic acid synthase SpsE